MKSKPLTAQEIMDHLQSRWVNRVRNANWKSADQDVYDAIERAVWATDSKNMTELAAAIERAAVAVDGDTAPCLGKDCIMKPNTYTEQEWIEKYRDYKGDGSIPAAFVLVEWDDPLETPSQTICRLNAEVIAIANATGSQTPNAGNRRKRGRNVSP